MTHTDTEILNHLSALSSAFSTNRTFDLDRFLEFLEADKMTEASGIFSGGSWLDSDPGEPKPGQICFPNGITNVLLLKHEDSRIETDNPFEAEYAAIDMEDECPLLLMMNEAMTSIVNEHPELEELDKFPYFPIRAMIRELFMIQSAAMRQMVKAAIRRVFLERTDSYFIRSPH